jgi:glycosyltransferase involved in cell wall biosynthesis
LLAQPNAFIPVSRWLAGDLLTTGVNAGRIRHVYDAVQFQASKLATPESTLRDELNLPPNTILVAMVGMMVSWKGQDHFIEAVSQLHQANPHTKFLIIGDTPERGHLAFAQSLQEQVRKLGLQQYIVFTGRRDDMALVLPQIDIVVSASKSPEPLGLVMLEAMGAGCVFIGPAFGAVPEVVTDGENGYTFTPNNPSALAASIQRALQHRADDQSMRERARKTIASRFCGRRCAAETAMVYQTLLTG